MKIFKAPQNFENHGSLISVFLAGSIEMGKAKNWQAIVEKEFNNYRDNVLSIFNPRRDDFDSSQEQSPENPYFSEQVLWELNAMEAADYIFMYFDPDTISPITLMELGLHVDEYKMVVVCPDGYFRKGNIEIVCETHNVPVYNTLEDGMKELREIINYDNYAFLK